jgi:hypothetical protein
VHLLDAEAEAIFPLFWKRRVFGEGKQLEVWLANPWDQYPPRWDRLELQYTQVRLTSEYVFQGEWIFYGMHSTSTTQQNEHVHDFVIGTEVHKITTSNNRAYRFLCATYKTLCGSRVYCQGKRVDRWDRGSGVALVYLAPRNPNQSKDTKACLKNHGMSEEYWCHSGSDIIVVNLLWP